jgi:fatty-acyl-CoA synthase
MERPLAVIVLRAGHTLDTESLRKHVEAKFAKWWIPDDFVQVDALPRTGTGKIKKAELRQQFAGLLTTELAHRSP